MAVKQKNTKKKMALLGLKKDNDGDYRYIDPDDTTSEFVPVRNRNKNKENKLIEFYSINLFSILGEFIWNIY